MHSEFSTINIRAAIITGAILGFLNSMMEILFGVSDWWNIAVKQLGFEPTIVIVSAIGTILLLTIMGALIGGLVAIIYNYALKIQKKE